MFVTVISKRIKSKKHEDWYVLVGTVLPFAPTVGMKIFMPPKSILTLTSVLWDNFQGCFHLMIGEQLCAIDSTPADDAELLIAQGPWTVRAAESAVNEAEGELVKVVMEDLKSKIMRAQMVQGSKVTPQMLKAMKQQNESKH